MAERKAFLLRVDPALLEAVQRWANDELRSLNGQIEFVLRQALRNAGRLAAPRPGGAEGSSGGAGSDDRGQAPAVRETTTEEGTRRGDQ